MLQGLAAAVLLTSCLNLANMMLAFGSARQKEIAIRLAVGGARSRIVRQLLVQGLMLSIAGGVLGLLVATMGGAGAGSSMATVLPITLGVRCHAGYDACSWRRCCSARWRRLASGCGRRCGCRGPTC